jgi:anti-anti-sigma factor
MPTIFRAPARFDSYGLPVVLAAIEVLAAEKNDVTVDMSDVEAFDGAGVGALASLYKRLSKAQRELIIINTGGVARDLLSKSGMLHVLQSPRWLALREDAMAEKSARLSPNMTPTVLMQPTRYTAPLAASLEDSHQQRDAA